MGELPARALQVLDHDLGTRVASGVACVGMPARVVSAGTLPNHSQPDHQRNFKVSRFVHMRTYEERWGVGKRVWDVTTRAGAGAPTTGYR